MHNSMSTREKYHTKILMMCFLLDDPDETFFKIKAFHLWSEGNISDHITGSSFGFSTIRVICWSKTLWDKLNRISEARKSVVVNGPQNILQNGTSGMAVELRKPQENDIVQSVPFVKPSIYQIL